ncbi:hypothetical protein QUC31_005662 [Theobroma cacao]
MLMHKYFLSPIVYENEFTSSHHFLEGQLYPISGKFGKHMIDHHGVVHPHENCVCCNLQMLNGIIPVIAARSFQGLYAIAISVVKTMVKNLLDAGEHTFPSPTFRLIDVRDVAYAHIQAFEIPSASGRYCLVERIVHYLEILKVLSEHYPALGLQEKCGDLNKPLERTYQISKEKAKSLGVSFIPWEVSLKEIVESLKEKGFLSI